MIQATPLLAELKRRPRREGEASFFFFDHGFNAEACKILPGEFFVYNQDIVIQTVLGSCVAACICDRGVGVGGMNHFMLPDGDDSSARYGVFAMEVLINDILKAGGRRGSLEAKVFGGAAVIQGMTQLNVGKQNVAFVERFLDNERIPIVSKDVQVAGGTTKTVLLVAPTSVDNAPIDIRLYRGDELVAKKPITMKVAEQVELVGVMPALATRVGKVPEQSNLATDTGKAQLVEVSLEQMALGSSALDVFDSIVATAADVRSLQPGQLSALLGWLNRGGRLLLDDATDLSALPRQWQPGANGWALAGRGEVHLVDGRASSGQWASIIEPSGSSVSESAGMFSSPEQLGSVQQDLARRSGVKLPSMVPLLVPLVTYLLLVSFVLFFLLKALRRLTLAWVAIPVLAALTAGIVVWYGQQWRSVGKPAVSVFVDGYPGGGDATASLLAFSRDGGTVKVGMPAAWQSDSEISFFFGGGASGAPPTLSPAADASQLRVRLEPGQVTSANVVGPVGDAGLTIDAHVQSGKVVGTVTNTASVTLHEVAIFAPGGARLLGTLAPGASSTYELDATALPSGFSLADRVWDSTADPRAAKDEIAEFGIWTNAAYGRVMYPSGMVRAAGWTTEQPFGFRVAGGVTTTSVLTAVAPIQPGQSPMPAAAVPRVIRRSMGTACALARTWASHCCSGAAAALVSVTVARSPCRASVALLPSCWASEVSSCCSACVADSRVPPCSWRACASSACISASCRSSRWCSAGALRSVAMAGASSSHHSRASTITSAAMDSRRRSRGASACQRRRSRAVAFEALFEAPFKAPFGVAVRFIAGPPGSPIGHSAHPPAHPVSAVGCERHRGWRQAGRAAAARDRRGSR